MYWAALSAGERESGRSSAVTQHPRGRPGGRDEERAARRWRGTAAAVADRTPVRGGGGRLLRAEAAASGLQGPELHQSWRCILDTESCGACAAVEALDHTRACTVVIPASTCCSTCRCWSNVGEQVTAWADQGVSSSAYSNTRPALPGCTVWHHGISVFWFV